MVPRRSVGLAASFALAMIAAGPFREGPEFATLSPVTHHIGHDRIDLRTGDTKGARRRAPDPVIGAGITLFGIFLMGTGGATDAHYVFDLGVLVGLGGAVTFVLFVALSALAARPAPKDDAPQA